MQHCGDPLQVEWLLQERVLDLAVLTRPASSPSADATDLLELPLQEHPGGHDVILLRHDLSEQPALQALIAALRQQVQGPLRQHPEHDCLG